MLKSSTSPPLIVRLIHGFVYIQADINVAVIGFLPMSLSTKRLAEKYEKHRGDGDPVEIAGVDLFSRDRKCITISFYHF